MPKRRRGRPTPMPLTGAAAFGADTDGGPTGSQAVGGADAKNPLRGALLFGNDPAGNPRGSESIGQPDAQHPLRGALLIGNDPGGSPRGSESIGQPDAKNPLRGALLFGNDPVGNARGAESFGAADQHMPYRGSMAVGAPQGFVEKLYKDDIGYDFAATIIKADEGSFAGMRKDPRDHLRKRILGVLGRLLDMDVEKLRHGLDEHAIKWGKLKAVASLDRPLAEELRRRYRRAPGEVLGIGHLRDVLEETERMHSFELRCDWDVQPVRLSVLWGDEEIGNAVATFHNEHRYFVFKDADGALLAYADQITPHQRRQEARVRDPQGKPVGFIALTAPENADDKEKQTGLRFTGEARDAAGKVMFRFVEESVTKDTFKARLLEPEREVVVGRVEDGLAARTIRARIELDLSMPCVLVWAFAAVLADLARLRRRGWPDKPETTDDTVESVSEALGPSRTRV